MHEVAVYVHELKEVGVGSSSILCPVVLFKLRWSSLLAQCWHKYHKCDRVSADILAIHLTLKLRYHVAPCCR